MNWWNIAVQFFWIFAPFVVGGWCFWLFFLRPKKDSPYFNPSKGFVGLIILDPYRVERIIPPRRISDAQGSCLVWNLLKTPGQFTGFFFAGATEDDPPALQIMNGSLTFDSGFEFTCFPSYGDGLRLDATVSPHQDARLIVTMGSVTEEYFFFQRPTVTSAG